MQKSKKPLFKKKCDYCQPLWNPDNIYETVSPFPTLSTSFVFFTKFVNMSCNLFVPGSVSVSIDTQKISSCLQVTLGYSPSKKYFFKPSTSGLPKDFNLQFLPGYKFASQTKYQLPGITKLLT